MENYMGDLFLWGKLKAQDGKTRIQKLDATKQQVGQQSYITFLIMGLGYYSQHGGYKEACRKHDGQHAPTPKISTSVLYSRRLRPRWQFDFRKRLDKGAELVVQYGVSDL